MSNVYGPECFPLESWSRFLCFAVRSDAFLSWFTWRLTDVSFRDRIIMRDTFESTAIGAIGLGDKHDAWIID